MTLAYDHGFQLFGIYPELKVIPDVTQWLQKYGLSVWREVPEKEGFRSLILISANEDRYLAIRLGWTGTTDARVLKFDKTAEVNLSGECIMPIQVLVAVMNEHKLTYTPEVMWVRPKYNWDDNKCYWDIRLRGKGTLTDYVYDGKGKLVSTNGIEERAFPKHDVAATCNDDTLASNVLHHPGEPEFVAYAKKVSSGTTTTKEVTDNIRQLLIAGFDSIMHYDATIPGILNFTWADLHIPHRLKWGGVCDEFSVMVVTLLRALGIPSCIKTISYVHPQLGHFYHSAVELKDGAKWVNFDVLQNIYDNKAAYRDNHKWLDVKVIHLSCPDDTRYTAENLDLVDHPDDGILHAFSDFKMYPSIVGMSEPGYSY